MEKPRVVVSVATSIDGRVSLRRDRPLMTTDDGKTWETLRPPSAQAVEEARTALLDRLYSPTVTLEGSGSMVPPSAGPLTGLPPAGPDEVYDDFLAVDAARWFAVVDGRGRVRWTMKEAGGQHLLVLVSHATPAAYLAYLRREGISYLVAGAQRVDLGAALRRMRSRLGVTCVVSSGGGGLNGALLRAGLVDEIQLIVLPAAIGGTGAGLFDGPALADGEFPTRLRLLSSQTEADGTLWLRYEVGRSR
ncbi:dihydrofolate reductase family protein [Actinoplanes sp. Pm04-4]|uniref:Dihydrofolate reductase family protein n=1 Tax=Paractinoplanes pyxinae TaxID=2997416 RepID=A0ABT4B7E6_9ACTN|nr:dihydrofolate reductase family protein [Actinoplanes pyxinae]MCY1142424.1 dihydrofolate reductase family protein [Actinoplanes pyxinae]